MSSLPLERVERLDSTMQEIPLPDVIANFWLWINIYGEIVIQKGKDYTLSVTAEEFEALSEIIKKYNEAIQ